MKKFPLQVLLDLAHHKEDEAAKSLNELKLRWDRAEIQRQQLIEYRQIYRQRLQESARTGASAMVIRDFNMFLVKLDKAIRLQDEEVARCQARWQAGQQAWLERRGDVRALDTLSSRYEQAEQAREHRREQKSMDEYSARRCRENHQDEEDDSIR